MISTIPRLHLNTIRTYLKDSLLSFKEKGQYIPISTQEFDRTVRLTAYGLRELGHSREDKLALLSENSPEWIIFDYANLCLGGITVPIYPTLVPEQIAYIIQNSESKTVVCSTPDLLEKVQSVKDKIPGVKSFILMNGIPPEDVLSLQNIREQGDLAMQKEPDFFEKAALSVKPEDLASIIYTSGTTGVPKGVMLSHGNFTSNVSALAAIVPFGIEDTALSFLPLSHVLERLGTIAFLSRGVTMAYAESIETVAENLMEVRPTIMISVPRLFDKIYARVMDNVLSSSGLKRKIFFWALKVGKKEAALRRNKKKPSLGLRLRRNLADKLVFAKITARTGGRVSFFVSGGAPLSKDVAEFFGAMGLVILEGYGLTETSPVLAVNTFDNIKLGTVGKPIPGVEIRIKEDGEILAKGPNIMQGYYKNPEETTETIKDGWLHTGDIGHLDEDGFLVITDRKKDIIITTGGKNVAPQPIENMLKTSPYIANPVVVGTRRNFISALIVPEFEKLEEYARQQEIPFLNRKELVENQAVIDFITAEIQRVTSNLASYETIKKIILLDKDFDIESGEMTPTLKVKRDFIEKKFKEQIDALYR
ncbi:MAG: long-chain fatty acid--CoA ligase [Candidatus Aminicenantes bacterium]|nr:long-chain fatty acid--CoA ligase [Candidatus Aminicenantes bacterium]